MYAVTSEPQTLASRAQSEWEFDFESVGDPHQEISGTCSDRGWLEVIVNKEIDFLRQATAELDFAVTHPKGHFQAGVLAVTAEGRVLYRWRGVPTRKNIGGAVGRVAHGYLWSRLEEALASATPGDAALDEDAKLETLVVPWPGLSPIDASMIPWPLFAALLVANGWFIRPLALAYTREDPDGEKRVPRAGLRLVGFIAAWAAAFWWGSPLVVGAALVAWLAWITPKLPFFNGEFQNMETR